MTREEASFYLANMDRKYMEEGMSEALDMAIKALEQEPCDNVCEWFEQYVDIATDIVELRFSDGTVKKTKRGLYLRDIEKSIRKMMIDQIANEKKQESKWIPVSERLPEVGSEVLVCFDFKGKRSVYISHFYGDGEFHGLDDEYLTPEGRKYRKAVAWMLLPEPYKGKSEDKE